MVQCARLLLAGLVESTALTRITKSLPASSSTGVAVQSASARLDTGLRILRPGAPGKRWSLRCRIAAIPQALCYSGTSDTVAQRHEWQREARTGVE
ncbi:hypothetical protein HDK90DRAFT_486062 [Phyllosticta capitalensis]|uniref:Secreted protein n=1 Tax=Phyllosticta capitalensis TaxID=121624 RepID=A0ABR1YR70_9PEZI